MPHLTDDDRAWLRELSDEAFIARWRAVVGEPPAVLLDNRNEMIALLLEAGLSGGRPRRPRTRRR